MATPTTTRDVRDAADGDSTYMTPGVIGACLTIVPNATLWYGIARGKTNLEALVKTTLRYAGVPGLLAIPFCGMAMEKCFYDSLVSLQGVDPNVQPDNRKMETFPAVRRSSRPCEALWTRHTGRCFGFLVFWFSRLIVSSSQGCRECRLN